MRLVDFGSGFGMKAARFRWSVESGISYRVSGSS